MNGQCPECGVILGDTCEMHVPGCVTGRRQTSPEKECHPSRGASLDSAFSYLPPPLPASPPTPQARIGVSHAALVAVAAAWLRRTCAVVITELSTIGETPDAIGWHGTHSTLVECKISRADFMADANKPFRRGHVAGIGWKRYFLTLPGIITPEDLPAKWGLLELTGDKVRVRRQSEHFADTNDRHEIGILLSALRRIGQAAPEGVSIKTYTIKTEGRATLGVVPANEQS